MARERVQVQGLGGAVPGIQPTIQRAGQYSVQVQRAGRNKLMDLADALGQVNPLLQQYTRVADLEAEQFEEELAGKSPEEVQAMLKQTEGELDKQVRRGGMGWLTSPLNQKRKRKAIGKLASRDLISEIQQRLINPKAGDPQDLTERANFIRQEYIDNTPALQSSVFAQEGLNEVTTAQIEGLISGAETREAAIAKSETLFATGASIYDKIETLLKKSNIQTQLRSGDFSFVVDTIKDSKGNIIGSVTLGDFIQQQWAETGAYTAKEQRTQLEKVLKNMATNGMGDQADGLLIWAKSNLNFGNAKMTSMEFDELEFLIDNAVEAEEERRDKDALDFVKEKAGEYEVKLNQLKYSEDGQVTYDGQTFSDKLELQKYFDQKTTSNPDLTNEQKANLLNKIKEATFGALRETETTVKNLILRDAPEASAEGISRELNFILKNIDIVEENKNDPSVKNVLYDAQDRITSLVSKYMEEELMGLQQEKAVQKAKIYARSLIEEETPKIEAKIREADDLLIEKAKPPKKEIKPDKLPNPADYNFNDIDEGGDLEELRKEVIPELENSITDDTTDETSNTAKAYLNRYGPEIATATAKAYFDIPYKSMIDELEAIAAEHFKFASRLDGVFTVDVLENIDDNGFAYTYAGIKFKPKQLIGNVNADKFVLLSEEQLEDAETEDGKKIVERIKQATGITLDTPEFIRLQRKRRKQYIVPYTPFPDSYRPIDAQKELEEFINKPTPAYDYFPLTDFLLMD